ASFERQGRREARLPDREELTRFERAHREIAGGVCPERVLDPAGLTREIFESFARIFVAVLRVNGLARLEFERFAADRHGLRFPAHKMHLDAFAGRIEESAMLEGGNIEIAIRLAVNTRKQI